MLKYTQRVNNSNFFVKGILQVPVNFKRKIFSFLCTIVFVSCMSFIYAIEPSEVVVLPDGAKFYINRNGGISHNTYCVEVDAQKKFFKETKVKLSLYDTAKRIIKEYFKDEYLSEQAAMLKSLENEENLNKFAHMKIYGDGKAAQWLKSPQKMSTDILGFTEYLPYEFRINVLPEFIHYAFAEFVQYNANRNVRIGDLQINHVLRNLATVRIAKLLGLSDLIVNTRYVKLITPDKSQKLGIILDCAKGVSFRQLKNMKITDIAPLFQRDMSDLMVLDALCAQRDREVANYFIVLSDEGEIMGVNAYDNDLSFDHYKNLEQKNRDLPALLHLDGSFILPHMNMNTANRILELTAQDINACLGDILDEDDINFTIERLISLQRAIVITTNRSSRFLLNTNQWSGKTIREEMDVKGDTYFKHFLKMLNKSQLVELQSSAEKGA